MLAHSSIPPPRHVLSSCRAPIARAGNCQLRPTVDLSWNQHGLISWKYCLAERNHRSSIILRSDCAGSIDTVWLVGEWFADVPIRVAVQATVLWLLVTIFSRGLYFSTYHGQRISIRSSFWIPLRHHLSRRTSIRTVRTRRTRLIRTHGPACVRRPGCNCDQTCVRRERTSSTFLQPDFNIFNSVRCV